MCVRKFGLFRDFPSDVIYWSHLKALDRHALWWAGDFWRSVVVVLAALHLAAFLGPEMARDITLHFTQFHPSFSCTISQPDNTMWWYCDCGLCTDAAHRLIDHDSWYGMSARKIRSMGDHRLLHYGVLNTDNSLDEHKLAIDADAGIFPRMRRSSRSVAKGANVDLPCQQSQSGAEMSSHL